MQKYHTLWISLYIVMALATRPAWGDGVHVGRSIGGQILIAVEPTFAGVNVLSPTLPGGFFQGWTGADPGYIDQLDINTPPEILPLESGAQVWLQAVSIDPAFQVIGTDFRIVQNPGDDTFLGDSTFIFDTHPTYHINSADPAFDPNQTVWSATFIIRDDGLTGYASSAPFTLHFTNVPFAVGDLNCDGSVNGDDIEPFIQAVLDPVGFITAFPTCNLSNGDLNADGLVDPADVSAFVSLMTKP